MNQAPEVEDARRALREAAEPGAVFRITVGSTGMLLADRVRVAVSLMDRLVGLLNRSSLGPGEGLVIWACRAIHTWFMRFAIDVVFVDRAWRVVALREAMPPWRLSSTVWRASGVIELPAGASRRARLKVGERLHVHPAEVVR